MKANMEWLGARGAGRKGKVFLVGLPDLVSFDQDCADQAQTGCFIHNGESSVSGQVDSPLNTEHGTIMKAKMVSSNRVTGGFAEELIGALEENVVQSALVIRLTS